MNSWAEHSPNLFLSKYKVQDVIAEKISTTAPKELVFLEEQDTLAKVMDVFHLNKILSAPVLAKGSEKIIGMLDMLDLITFLTAKLSFPFLTTSIATHEVNAFLSKTARDVVELSSRNWWNEVYEKTPSIELVKLLSSPNLHRVAVLNEHKKVCNIVSQMDLLVFLYNHRENFPLLREPISSWNKEKSVESIEWNCAVAEAFKKIWESEVTGIAVLDDDGKLVGNISASDLKNCGRTSQELILDLYQPIKHFLGIFDDDEDEQKKRIFPPKQPVVCAKTTDTLEHILELLVKQRVHRIYIVDNESAPLFVISPSDVIAQFKDIPLENK